MIAQCQCSLIRPSWRSTKLNWLSGRIWVRFFSVWDENDKRGICWITRAQNDFFIDNQGVGLLCQFVLVAQSYYIVFVAIRSGRVLGSSGGAVRCLLENRGRWNAFRHENWFSVVIKAWKHLWRACCAEYTDCWVLTFFLCLRGWKLDFVARKRVHLPRRLLSFLETITTGPVQRSGWLRNLEKAVDRFSTKVGRNNSLCAIVFECLINLSEKRTSWTFPFSSSSWCALM